jgi:uncharacterized protein YciI
MYAVNLTFSDDPRRLEARPAHRAFLAQLREAGELVAAGPFAGDVGALLLFDVDHDRMQEILRQDPYYETPGITVSWVNEWSPLFEIRG